MKSPRCLVVAVAFAVLVSVKSGASAAAQPVGIGGGGAFGGPSYSPLNPNLAFVFSDMSDAYRTTDGGASWTTLDFMQIATAVDYPSFGPFFNLLACPVAYHPSNANTVYGYGYQTEIEYRPAEMLVSTDAGTTWAPAVASPPWGGARITRIYIDRGDANFRLVGTDTNSYRSTDGGVNWAVCAGVNGYVLGFQVDYGTSAGNRTVFSGTASGVYKSLNEGATWAGANSGLPSNSLNSFVGGSTASATTLFAVHTNGNVYRTTNGGASWSLSSSTTTFFQVAASDSDANVAYANDYNVRDVYKTTNAGSTWAPVFVDVTNPSNYTPGWEFFDLTWGWSGSFFAMGVDPVNSSRLLGANWGEVLRTTDGGVNWDAPYTSYQDSGARAQGKKWTTTGLEDTNAWHYDINPTNASRHYICYTDIGFARSTDGGGTWISSRTGSPWTNTFYQIAFHPTPGVLFAAASSKHDIPHSTQLVDPPSLGGGVVKSTDDGATWANVSSGLPAVPATSIVYDTSTGTHYVAMWSNGVWKSTNGGGSWASASTGLSVGANLHVYSLKLHPDGTLFCLISGKNPFTNPGGLFKTTNGGTSWTNIASNADPVNGGGLYYPMGFDFDPGNSSIVYIAAHNGWGGPPAQAGIYKTTNGGGSWNVLSLPGSSWPYAGFEPIVYPGNPNWVYLATENRGLYRSTDAGATWARETWEPFASCQRMTFDTPNARLFLTTFGGGVWTYPFAPPGSTLTPTASATALPGTSTATVTLGTPSSATPSSTRSTSLTASATASYTRTATPSSSFTITRTPSPTPSRTATSTPSPTATPSRTFTATATVSATAEPTPAGPILAVPNPVPHGATNVTFLRVPPAISIRIYTVSGERVRTLTSPASGGNAVWDLENESGSRVAPGLYYFAAGVHGHGLLIVL